MTQLPPYRPRKSGNIIQQSPRPSEQQEKAHLFPHPALTRWTENLRSNDLSDRGRFHPSTTDLHPTSYRSRSLDNLKQRLNGSTPAGGKHTMQRAESRKRETMRVVHRSRHDECDSTITTPWMTARTNERLPSSALEGDALDRWRMGFRDCPGLASPARGETGYLSPRTDRSLFYESTHPSYPSAHSSIPTARLISPSSLQSIEGQSVAELKEMVYKLLDFNKSLRNILKYSLVNPKASETLCTRCKCDMNASIPDTLQVLDHSLSPSNNIAPHSLSNYRSSQGNEPARNNVTNPPPVNPLSSDREGHRSHRSALFQLPDYQLSRPVTNDHMSHRSDQFGLDGGSEFMDSARSSGKGTERRGEFGRDGCQPLRLRSVKETGQPRRSTSASRLLFNLSDKGRENVPKFAIPTLKLEKVGTSAWLSGQVTNGDTYTR